MSSKMQDLIKQLHAHLARNKQLLFRVQHRDKSKRKLSWKGSFTIGRGSTQPGHIKYIDKYPGFLKHNFKNTGVYNEPIQDQYAKWSKQQRLPKIRAYLFAYEILKTIDPDYASGEFIVQFAYMNANGFVKIHKDKEDISHQYALSVGDFTGAKLRVYHEDFNEKSENERSLQIYLGNYTDIDYRNKVVKFDGRRAHEVVTNNFEGERFTIIYYKNYDHRKDMPDPIFPYPEIVHE